MLFVEKKGIKTTSNKIQKSSNNIIMYKECVHISAIRHTNNKNKIKDEMDN